MLQYIFLMFFFYYTMIVVVKRREFDQGNGRFIYLFINYLRAKLYDVCIFNRYQRFQISFP